MFIIELDIATDLIFSQSNKKSEAISVRFSLSIKCKNSIFELLEKLLSIFIIDLGKNTYLIYLQSNKNEEGISVILVSNISSRHLPC